jgi:addiction module HigA family antidote
MVRRKPIHPGEILRKEFLDKLNVTAYRLAKDLQIPRTRVSAIVNGHRAITADTAVRLSRYFGNSAEFWLNLQSKYELELVRRGSARSIARIVKPLHEHLA